MYSFNPASGLIEWSGDMEEISAARLGMLYRQADEGLTDYQAFVNRWVMNGGIVDRVAPNPDGTGNYLLTFKPGDAWYDALEQRGIAKKNWLGNFVIPSNKFASSLPGYGIGEADDASTIGPIFVAAVLTAGIAAYGSVAVAGAEVAGEAALVEGAGESFLIGDAATDTLIEETIMDDILVNDIWGTENFSFAEDFSFPYDSTMSPDIPGIDSFAPDLVTQQNTLPLFDNVLNQAIKLGGTLVGKFISPQQTTMNPTARTPTNPFYNPLPGMTTGQVTGDVNPYASTGIPGQSYIMIGIGIMVVMLLGIFLTRR